MEAGGAGGPDIALKSFIIGFALIMAGVFVIIAGTLYAALRGGGRGEAGGVVVIGPFPIVWGTSSEAVKIAVIGAIVLMLLALVILFLLPWGPRRVPAGGPAG